MTARWTGQAPTEPGFYWLAQADGAAPHVVCVSDHDRGRLAVEMTGTEVVFWLDARELRGARWAGPILQPEGLP